ncbi:MAG: cache and HAMP domain-containing protein [Gammaproteobacteria bacterium]|jgi:HAMP domain-containing protein
MFSIRTKLLFLMLPITIGLLAGLGYVNYLKTTEMSTRAIQDQLQTIANARQIALVEYIESTEKIGNSIAASEIVQTYIELVNRNLRGTNNRETVDMLGKRVEDLLYSFQESHWGRYQRIFLIDRSNRIVISPKHGLREKGSPSALLGEDMSSNPWAMGAMQKGKEMLSDYRLPNQNDNGKQSMFIPVRDVSNRVQAVIGFELDLSYQQQIITQDFSLGKTGRIYLISERGVAITQKGPPPLTGELLNQVKLNGASTGRRLDELGQEVIGFYSMQKQYPWIVAIEIETGDVFAGLYELQIMLIVGLTVTLVILTVLLVVFANSIVKPVRELVSQVERISLGEFNIDIPDPRRRDEIGKLIEAMQRLVFSLQLVSKKLRQAKAFKKAS